ncbi:hypothetical protein AC1031_013758 [Aphanomyces cochlioides]|nr:hypothetical protein AC1031_013758 [Aphanomyces cochlioides]
MRIIFPLLFAVAAFAFGQEQPNELLAEDSRALLAAGRHGRGRGRGRGFGGFGRGFRHGGGHMAAPPAESDVAADIPSFGGRPPFGRGFPGGRPMGHFGGHFGRGPPGGHFGRGPPGGAGAPQDAGQADEANRLLLTMGRRGRGGGRRGGGRRGGGRRGGGRRGSGGRRSGGRRGRIIF